MSRLQGSTTIIAKSLFLQGGGGHMSNVTLSGCCSVCACACVCAFEANLLSLFTLNVPFLVVWFE